jgi:hypothetical protein
VLHVYCAGHGTLGVIGTLHGRTKNDQNGIADEFIDRAMIALVSRW